MSASAPAIRASVPARVRTTIVTRMLLALAGLVLLLAAMGGLSVWGVMRAEAELRRAEQSLVQLENARAVEAAFNSYLLGEVDRRLRGGGDPAESREAAMVRGALLTVRRLIGAEISTSDSEAERAAERAELTRANALAEIFEIVETRSILDRIAGRHFASGQAARAFQDEVVQGQDVAFRAIVSEVVEDERAESLSALQALEDLRSDLAIAWTALAAVFLALAAGFGIAFHRDLMTPIRALTTAAENVGGAAAPQPIRARLPGEFQQVADRFNAMAERIGSERRRLGDEVAARTAELQAANDRLAAIDAARRRFFANLSHELRTPVTVLLGEAQVALRAGRAGSGEREALERIAASGGMLRRRLDDLMRLARSEEGELALDLGPCDLGDAVRSAVEAARAYAATNEVELIFDDGASCRLNGDPEALRQAALALIDNSIKLSEPGSAVHVRMHPDGFEVADRGPGFEGCDPAKLFERYAQEGPGRRAGGSGLGLAIVKWIAEQHGARIRAEDRPGGGAVFRMEFT
jgi:two-component system, OmpR family, sensor kinase